MNECCLLLTFNQQNCQHPELHTPAARRCFRPHHPLAATSCGDRSIRPRIDIGSKSCRRDLPSYSCRSLHMFPCSLTVATDHVHESGRPCRTRMDTRWKDASLHLPFEVADIYIRRGVLISCPPQCHLQMGALHMKKQVGAIRRKIAKPGPGLRLCVQGIPRIFHGGALFLAVQCTKEGQTNLQKVPSHGVFLPEDMRPGKSPASMTLRADTLPLLNGKDVVSRPVKACLQNYQNKIPMFLSL